MRGLIICQFAFTSKNMIDKVTDMAKEYSGPLGGIEIECAAVANINEINFPAFDVVLLAPQIRNYLDQVKAKCEPLHIPVGFIDVVDYGMSRADKVIAQMEDLYEKKQQGQV